MDALFLQSFSIALDWLCSANQSILMDWLCFAKPFHCDGLALFCKAFPLRRFGFASVCFSSQKKLHCEGLALLQSKFLVKDWRCFAKPALKLNSGLCDLQRPSNMYSHKIWACLCLCQKSVRVGRSERSTSRGATTAALKDDKETCKWFHIKWGGGTQREAH